MKTKKEKKVNQGATLDITNRRDIISRFKDLIDIGPILDIDCEEEMCRFKKKLEEAGWGDEQVKGMVQIACSKSTYLRDLPTKIKNRGNFGEWLSSRARTK